MNALAKTRIGLLGAFLLAPLVHATPPAAPAGSETPTKAAETPVAPAMTFGWPFVDPEKMKVRGGTTTGSKVTLETAPAAAWERLHEPDLTVEQRDRRAILAMAGSYRVSFQFVETMGFSESYAPARPYFSWGTEEIRVLENNDRLISLQHTLVMYFEDEDGKQSPPMVMKHWRQDWRYEDGDLHTYRGNNRWKRLILPDDSVEGRWTQTVYQVDDSPRYEVLGRWNHSAGKSTWKSSRTMRPLPRREFSVRDDYNVLEGTHAITITPTGWVHVQNNRKIDLQAGLPPSCIACEIGINRYERISAPDLKAPADKYFAATGPYWREVRLAWAQVFQKYEQFRLRSSYNDQKLYEHHFAYAAGIKNRKSYKPIEARKHARETIHHFLQVRKRAPDAAARK